MDPHHCEHVLDKQLFVEDCELLLVGKGWLGGVKAKGGVNMIEMATVLHDAKVSLNFLGAELLYESLCLSVCLSHFF